MNTPLVAALCATLALAACSTVSNSRLNPFNWFGGSEEAAVVSPLDQTADKRVLVAQVIDMKLEKMPGGVIVRATGLPPTQGYWEADLVARPVEDGVIIYDFRVFPPVDVADISTQQSREVTVATFLTDIKLEQIRQITVQGETNARTSRR